MSWSSDLREWIERIQRRKWVNRRYNLTLYRWIRHGKLPDSIVYTLVSICVKRFPVKRGRIVDLRGTVVQRKRRELH